MQKEVAHQLQKLPLLTLFPPILQAYAYGSAVFKQEEMGPAASKKETENASFNGFKSSDEAATNGGGLGAKMVDLIFVVENATEWHRENVSMRPQDYSWLGRKLFEAGSRGRSPPPKRTGGEASSVAERLQRAGGSLWYNADVHLPLLSSSSPFFRAAPLSTIRSKYGVIGLDDFVGDLTRWTTLYAAGRFHKPVLPLIQASAGVSGSRSHEGGCSFASHSSAYSSLLAGAILQNRRYAFWCAMLMLLLEEQLVFSGRCGSPVCSFSLPSLLGQILSLSFLGDVRMRWAEDPLKRQKILAGQSVLLRDMYLEVMRGELGDINVSYDPAADDRLHITCALPELQVAIASKIPERLQKALGFAASSASPELSSTSTALSDSFRRLRAAAVREAIASIVWWPAIVQSAKGLLSVSPGTSASYVLRKLKKRLS